MPTRTEVEKLNAKISSLREVLDVAMSEVTKLQGENWELKRRLHRKWNKRTHPFQCPVCRRWVRLLEAQLAMNDEVLYVVAECRTHGRVTPTGRWTVSDLVAALPKET